MTQEFATVDYQQIAGFVANKLQEVAVPSSTLRKDIGDIQVDPVIIIENYEEIPAIRLEFEMDGGFGMEVKVRVKDFVANPQAYMRDVFENVNGIRYAAELRRQGHDAQVRQVMNAMGAKR